MKRINRDWRMYSYAGQQRNLSEIARMVGVLPGTLRARIDSGKSLAEALAMPKDGRRRREVA